MEDIHFFDLGCRTCDIVARDYHIRELLIVKLAKLTARDPLQTKLSQDQLMDKIDELKDLISKLRPMVAITSFALGILYKELADVYEVLGRMDKCVEAYKMLIPIVE